MAKNILKNLRTRFPRVSSIKSNNTYKHKSVQAPISTEIKEVEEIKIVEPVVIEEIKPIETIQVEEIKDETVINADTKVEEIVEPVSEENKPKKKKKKNDNSGQDTASE